MIIPYRRARDSTDVARLAGRAQHRPPPRPSRVEHTFAHYKTWKVLPTCRRKGNGVYYATTAVAPMRNITLTN